MYASALLTPGRQALGRSAVAIRDVKLLLNTHHHHFNERDGGRCDRKSCPCGGGKRCRSWKLLRNHENMADRQDYARVYPSHFIQRLRGSPSKSANSCRDHDRVVSVRSSIASVAHYGRMSWCNTSNCMFRLCYMDL